jgi:hypothetical protein
MPRASLQLADLRRQVREVEILFAKDETAKKMKIIEPLMRIAEHMQGPSVEHIWACIAWSEMEPIEREPIVKAVLAGESQKWERIVSYLERLDIEYILHDAIWLWSVRAFDCMAELNRRKCPPKMGQLYDKLARISSSTGVLTTTRDWVEIRELYSDTIAEIDEYIAAHMK